MKSNKKYIAASLITQMIVLPIIMTVGFILISSNSRVFPSLRQLGPDSSQLTLLLIGFLSSLLIGGFLGFIFSRKFKLKPDTAKARYLPLLFPMGYALIFALLAVIFAKTNYNSAWWGLYLFKNPAFLIFGFLIFLEGMYYLLPGVEVLAYTGFLIGLLIHERITRSTCEGKSSRTLYALTLVCVSTLIFSGFLAKTVIRDGITEVLYGESTIGKDLTEFDLLGKTPFKENNGLAKLENPASIQFTKFEEMPRLDGATAAYPVYAAFAEAVYTGLGDYYETHKDSNTRGIDTAFVESGEYPYNIVKCSKTEQAYERLINGETDIIFVAEPSKVHLEIIKSKGDEFILTPIGSEAFVFFTNAKNPVENLTLEQIREIYSGKITNWKEVGGPNRSILPYQRPENSGSQTVMQNKVMKDAIMLEPTKVTYAGGMGEIISRVASYKNAKNSLGYSFMYYSSEMIKNNQIKYLAINGVKPTSETVRNKTYSFTVPVYAVTLKSNNHENVERLLQWVLSEEGQQLIEQTGYVSIK